MVRWTGYTKLDKALSVVLILLILGAIGALAYVVGNPKVGEEFTEFYILSPGGVAVDYPRQLKVGEEGGVIVGVINREHETVSYRLEVRIDGAINNKVGPVILEHEGKLEQIITFAPDKPGDNQKVEFLLYKQGQAGVCQSLHLWVDVKEQEETSSYWRAGFTGSHVVDALIEQECQLLAS